jgi:hypothetical protein
MRRLHCARCGARDWTRGAFEISPGQYGLPAGKDGPAERYRIVTGNARRPLAAQRQITIHTSVDSKTEPLPADHYDCGRLRQTYPARRSRRGYHRLATRTPAGAPAVGARVLGGSLGMTTKKKNLAAEVFASFARALAPEATIARAVDMHDGEPSMLFCNRPDCRAVVEAHAEWLTIPLRQRDLDDMAIAENHPIDCDRCGATMTATVNGPDPRD